MVSREQTLHILEKLKNIKPIIFFQKINNANMGTKFVLAYLEQEKEVYASSLSEIMHISRARISVIVDKLIQKGLIKKEQSKKDARKDVISITELGRQEVYEKRKCLEDDVMKVIDSVGMDKMLSFIEVAEKIRDILK